MIELTKLAAQGRAYSAVRPWETEELEALLLLERERGLGRLIAADHVRNGILTLEAYDAATKAGFKPKTLEEAASAAELSLKDNEFAGKSKLPAEPVADKPVKSKKVKK